MEGTDDTGDNSLTDAYGLTSNQFVVQDGDESITQGDPDEEVKTDEPLREQDRFLPIANVARVMKKPIPANGKDRFLPIANVARIMKKSIPANGKIAKDAKECVQECVSEFISFITSEASERCHQEKRKTINGEDILFAMSTLGFDNYVEPLKAYLQKYRESSKGDKAMNVNAAQEPSMDEINEDSFSAVNMLTSEGTVQPGVILANYPSY